MSYTTGPFTATVGVPLNLTPPNNAPWGSVVLSNASPFLLTIQGSGAAVFLLPFTADLYSSPGTHAPLNVSVSAFGASSGETGQVTATWYDPQEQPPGGTYPVSLTSQAVVSVNPAPSTLAGPTPFTGALVSPAIPVPPSTRTLTVQFANTPAGIVQVTGQVTGAQYYVAPVYLPNHMIVVPLQGFLDTSVVVTAPSNVGPNTFTVSGDTVQYRESVFYNGVPIPSAAAPGAGSNALLQAGPCRLLSASIIGLGSSQGSITLGASPVAILPVQTVAGQILIEALPIAPPGILIPTGSNVSVTNNTGAVSGFVTTAYP